jgi:hypothetical protein
METKTGIKYEKDTRGRTRYVRIDLEKYTTKDSVQELLDEIFANRNVDGQAEQSPYSKEYVAMINQAERDIKEGKGKKIAIADLWK